MESDLGRIPNTYAFSTYDSVWIIGMAILEKQTTDMSTIKEIIPDIAENYSGIIGSTRLNEAGDLDNSNYEIWGVSNAEWILVGKYDSVTDSYETIDEGNRKIHWNSYMSDLILNTINTRYTCFNPDNYWFFLNFFES